MDHSIVKFLDQIKVENSLIHILELSESMIKDLEDTNENFNHQPKCDTRFSLLRELHDAISKIKNFYIILYIQRGALSDQYLTEYLESNQMSDNFTLVRSRDILMFMIGCLFKGSNKIKYASLYKNSVSSDLYKIMNHDESRKDYMFKHINLKEFLKIKHKADLLKLLQKYIAELQNLKKIDESNSARSIKTGAKEKMDTSAVNQNKSTADTLSKHNQFDQGYVSDTEGCKAKTKVQKTKFTNP